ncbi:MAG: hypothetical protein JW891_00170 [Candidatus Lokiarchaeota archaeon]|nr:hypothetical protein [Candidatus Lokiarchaeota archaeon]
MKYCPFCCEQRKEHIVFCNLCGHFLEEINMIDQKRSWLVDNLIKKYLDNLPKDQRVRLKAVLKRKQKLLRNSTIALSLFSTAISLLCTYIFFSILFPALISYINLAGLGERFGLIIVNYSMIFLFFGKSVVDIYFILRLYKAEKVKYNDCSGSEWIAKWLGLNINKPLYIMGNSKKAYYFFIRFLGYNIIFFVYPLYLITLVGSPFLPIIFLFFYIIIVKCARVAEKRKAPYLMIFGKGFLVKKCKKTTIIFKWIQIERLALQKEFLTRINVKGEPKNAYRYYLKVLLKDQKEAFFFLLNLDEEGEMNTIINCLQQISENMKQKLSQSQEIKGETEFAEVSRIDEDERLNLLSMAKYCPYCKTKVGKEKKICLKCGYSLKDIVSARQEKAALLKKRIDDFYEKYLREKSLLLLEILKRKSNNRRIENILFGISLILGFLFSLVCVIVICMFHTIVALFCFSSFVLCSFINFVQSLKLFRKPKELEIQRPHRIHVKKWILDQINLKINGSIDVPSTSKALFYLCNLIIFNLITFVISCANLSSVRSQGFSIYSMLNVFLMLIVSIGFYTFENILSKKICVPRTALLSEGLLIRRKRSKGYLLIEWNKLSRVNIEKKLIEGYDEYGSWYSYYEYYLRVIRIPEPSLRIKLEKHSDDAMEIMTKFVKYIKFVAINEKMQCLSDSNNNYLFRSKKFYCSYCGTETEKKNKYCQLCGNENEIRVNVDMNYEKQ